MPLNRIMTGFTMDSANSHLCFLFAGLRNDFTRQLHLRTVLLISSRISVVFRIFAAAAIEHMVLLLQRDTFSIAAVISSAKA